MPHKNISLGNDMRPLHMRNQFQLTLDKVPKGSNKKNKSPLLGSSGPDINSRALRSVQHLR